VTPAVDDDARWAEAQSLLDRLPTESAEASLRRWRMRMVLLVVALVLGGAALGLVVVLAVSGGGQHRDDVPTWQEITGLVVMGFALVLMIVGLVVQIRGNRRLRVWSQPFAVLTRDQRKEVAAMVKGRAPVRKDRLPLARYMAEATVHQRAQVTGQIGLLLLFVGQWLSRPGTVRLVIVLGYAALLAIAIPFLRRGVVRAQRFLEEHPSGGDQ
jgi:hypothetical protein